MTEIDALQERVDAIRATGDADLAGRTFLLLGRELRAHFNEKLKRRNFRRFAEPVTQIEVDWILSDMQEANDAQKENRNILL